MNFILLGSIKRIPPIKTPLVLAFFGLLFLAVTLPSSAAAHDWKAAVGRVNITPPAPMWMSGYASRTEPASGKLTDLWAKCLVLEDAHGTRLVLVTLDLIGIDRDLSLGIRQDIEKQLGLDRRQVLLAASHTHTGPVVNHNLAAMYFLDETETAKVRDYARNLHQSILALTADTAAQLLPASVEFGTGHATFAVNRRNNAEPDVPDLRNSGSLKGPFDHDVPVLAVRDSGHHLVAVVCGYACHATTLASQEWSGDWPGFAQLALEERHPNLTSLFWAGCGADLNPLPRRTVELARNYGDQLADAVDHVLSQPMTPITGPIASAYSEIPLQFDRLPTLPELERAQSSNNKYEAGRARILLELVRARGALSPAYPYPIQSWRLGNGPAIVALGGEVVVDYALRIKNLFGRQSTWVMAYANDVMAYIPSERVLKEGGYEGGGAMVYYGLPSPWAAGLEDQIIQVVSAQLGQLGLNPVPQTHRAPYPNHADLTTFLDSHGRPHLIQSTNDWNLRRASVLAGMQDAMGPLPALQSLPPLDVIVTAEIQTNGYRRINLTYRADHADRVPAWLLLPDQRKSPGPAVLCLHPTSPLGKNLLLGAGDIPNRNYAHELAQRGFVCLVPDYPSFGDYKKYDFDSDTYSSGTMKGIVNHIRGVDLLSQRPEVDPDRIGVIGHSLGGHNAMFVAAFDPRLKVIVASCGWTPFHDYYHGRIHGWTSDRYMPRLKTRYNLDPNFVPFDFHELVAALAPRHFFSSSPLHDHNFNVDGVRKTHRRAAAVYELHTAADHLEFVYPDCAHDFPPEIRERAYKFLERL